MPGRVGEAAAALLAAISLETLLRLAVGRLILTAVGFATAFLPVAFGVARGLAKPETPAGLATRETTLRRGLAATVFCLESLPKNLCVPGLAPLVIRL